MLKISAHLQPIHLHDELGHDPIEVDPLGNRLLSVQHLECFKLRMTLNFFVKTLYRVFKIEDTVEFVWVHVAHYIE